MKERPLLFKSLMVRATLDGTKTHTRRIVKPDYLQNGNYEFCHVLSGTETNILSCKQPSAHAYAGFKHHQEQYPRYYKCPYGQVGDQLWVRETWRWNDGTECGCSEYCHHSGSGYEYRATGAGDSDTKWKPSIFMARKASRIQLEITGVRVERLQDISEEDAMAEGCQTDIGEGAGLFWFDGQGKNKTGRAFAYNAREAYSWLWEEINGAGSWDLNPLVWVIEFKRIKPL